MKMNLEHIMTEAKRELEGTENIFPDSYDNYVDNLISIITDKIVSHGWEEVSEEVGILVLSAKIIQEYFECEVLEEEYDRLLKAVEILKQ